MFDEHALIFVVSEIGISYKVKKDRRTLLWCASVLELLSRYIAFIPSHPAVKLILNL